MKLVITALKLVENIHGNKKIEKWDFHEKLFNHGNKNDYIIGTEKRIRDYYPNKADIYFVNRVFDYQAHATRTDGKISVAAIRNIAAGVGGQLQTRSLQKRGKGKNNKEKLPSTYDHKAKRPGATHMTAAEKKRKAQSRYYGKKIARFHSALEVVDMLVGTADNGIKTIVKNAMAVVRSADPDMLTEGDIAALKDTSKKLKAITGVSDRMTDQEMEMSMAANNPIDTSYFYDSLGTRHKFDDDTDPAQYFGGILAALYDNQKRLNPTVQLNVREIVDTFEQAYHRNPFWKKVGKEFDADIFYENASGYLAKKEYANILNAKERMAEYKSFGRNDRDYLAAEKEVADSKFLRAEYLDDIKQARSEVVYSELKKEREKQNQLAAKRNRYNNGK